MWIGVLLAVYASLLCTFGMHGNIAGAVLVDQFAIILCALASVVDLRTQRTH